MHTQQADVTSRQYDDWDAADRLAAETMERIRQRPLKVVAIEIDGLQVWPQVESPPPAEVDEPPPPPPPRPEERRMVRAELLGSHTHTTLTGVEVHVWQR